MVQDDADTAGVQPEAVPLRLGGNNSGGASSDETAPDLANVATVDGIEHLLAVAESLSNPISLELGDEPHTWKDALESSDAEQWRQAYSEELDSLKGMNVYKLVPRSQVPAGHKICKGHPVFKIKRDENGKIVRFKVCLMFKGFEQVYGKDYTKTTSPTAHMESWHILLHLAALKGWDATQIDVKTAFLYGLLPDDEIQYMQQPEGFEVRGKEDWVWCLLCGLYSMKQAGRIWNHTVNEKMIHWGLLDWHLSRVCTTGRRHPAPQLPHSMSMIFCPSPAARPRTTTSKSNCGQPGQSQTWVYQSLLLALRLNGIVTYILYDSLKRP